MGSGLLFCVLYVCWAVAHATEQTHAAELSSFNTIYEPSGVAHIGQGEFIVVEDEPENPFHRLKLDKHGQLVEMGSVEISGEPVRLNDLEGVTFDGRYVYAVTSHSLTKKGKTGKDRSVLVRFEYVDGMLHDARVVSDLKPLVIDLFSAAFNGLESEALEAEINIEAVAWSPRDESLYLGFRKPLLKGRSAVMRIDAPERMFQRQSAAGISAQLFWLDLQNKGIRSMSWDVTRQRMMIVAGRKKLKTGFDLWQWQPAPKTMPVRITRLRKALPDGTEGLTTYTIQDLAGMLLVIDDGNEKKAKPGHYQLNLFIPD